MPRAAIPGGVVRSRVLAPRMMPRKAAAKASASVSGAIPLRFLLGWQNGPSIRGGWLLTAGLSTGRRRQAWHPREHSWNAHFSAAIGGGKQGGNPDQPGHETVGFRLDGRDAGIQAVAVTANDGGDEIRFGREMMVQAGECRPTSSPRSRRLKPWQPFVCSRCWAASRISSRGISRLRAMDGACRGKMETGSGNRSDHPALVQLEGGMHRANRIFLVFFVHDDGNLDFGGGDHVDVNPCVTQRTNIMAATPLWLRMPYSDGTDFRDAVCGRNLHLVTDLTGRSIKDFTGLPQIVRAG